MKRPAWPRMRARAPQARIDPAPALLTRLADDVEAHAADALRGRGIASHDLPVCGTWLPLDRDDAQTWHSDIGDGVDVWCALDRSGARGILEIVLGGPGAPKPTALERGIVRETVERLLASTNRVWEERAESRFPSTACWICRVSIAAAGRGEPAQMCFYAPAVDEAPSPIAQRVDLHDVPVTLMATLPAAEMRVGAIAAWRPGAVVPLGCEAESAVSLFAGPARVASGRLGTIRGKRAIRIDREHGH